MEAWKQSLIRQATMKGMCADNMDALSRVESKSDAIRLYKHGIDWALEKQYPGYPLLARFFSDCEDQGIFVGREFHGEVLDGCQQYVFHNCRGHIKVDLNVKRAIIPMLYMADGCDMTVTRAESAHSRAIRVPIYSFGENIVSARDNDDIEFKIYRFELE